MGTTTFFWDGLIDEVEFFNRALTEAEIRAIYEAGSAGKIKPPAPIEPPAGMVSWWPGDEHPNDIIDGNHGTLQGGATYAPGLVGQAFSFDASLNSGVTVPSSANLNPTEAITIDAWVYPTSFPNPAPTVMRKSHPTSLTPRYLLAVTDTGQAHCNIGGFAAPVAGVVPLNEWTHIACTYDRVAARLYVNGSEVASSPGTAAIPTASTALGIGKLPQVTSRNFDGLIDEVELFDRALTEAEIRSIYNAGSAGKIKPEPVEPPTGMVAWWPGDDHPNDIIDGNHGTPVGGATYAPGLVDEAFSLDGVDDYVQIANTPTMDFGTGNFTIDLWVNFESLSENQELIHKSVGSVPDDTNKTYFVEFNTPNSLRFRVSDIATNVNDLIVPVALVVGQWYHIAAVRTGNTNIIYLDGTLIGTQTAGSNVDTGSGGFARIGQIAPNGVAGIDRHLHGRIDEVELFDRALTEAEIRAIYEAGSAGKIKPPAPVDPPAGMVSWWPGDDHSNDIIDGNNGTLVGGVTYTGGLVDEAFSFDGAPGTRVSIPDADNLRFAGGFTFDAWVKTTSSGTPVGSDFVADVLRKRNRDDGGLMDIGIGMINDVTRFFLTDDAGHFDAAAGIQGTTIINDGRWHHIAGVRDTAAGEARLFVDGVLEASLTDTTGTFLEVNTVPWNIGNVPGSGGFRYPWDGLIDEVEIFDRALTEAEIRAIYEAGTAGKIKPVPPEFTGDHIWSRSFGGPVHRQEGEAVAAGCDGRVAFTGQFEGTISVGTGRMTSAGGYDIFVRAPNTGGTSFGIFRTFGDADDQYAAGVACDSSGNAVLTGHFAGNLDFGGGPLASAGGFDIFLAKIEPLFGSHVWSKSFGDAALIQFGESVAVDSGDNVVLAGYFEGTVNFGGANLSSPGDDDAFLARFDTDGNHLWSKSFGDSIFDQNALSVAVAADGSILLAGGFQGDVDFGGGALSSTGSFDIFVANFDADGNHIWSKSFGSNLSEIAQGVAVDSNGNVVLAGYIGGDVDFGGGTLTGAGFRDVFVAKFESDGDHIWSRSFGETDHQQADSVALDPSGNVFITGEFRGTVDFGGGPFVNPGGPFQPNIFLARFDSNGNHIWSGSFGDEPSDVGNGVAADSSGVYATGYIGGTTDFGGGPLTSHGSTDVFMAKLDTAGNFAWHSRGGDDGERSPDEVATDAAGNVFVVGDFAGEVDLGGGVLRSAGPRWADVFVVKYDQDGNHIWSKSFGDEDGDHARAMTLDSSGNLFVAGSFRGTLDFGGGDLTNTDDIFSDMFLAKFDGDGNHLWSKSFGSGDGSEHPNGLAVDSAGNVIVVGFFSDSFDFGGGLLTSTSAFDAFVAKFDPDGNHIWSNRYGEGSGHDYANGVVVDGSDNIAVAGSFWDSIDFGGGVLNSVEREDAYLTKLDSAGNHVWSRSFGGSGDQEAEDAALDSSDNLVISGRFEQNIDLGGGQLASAGSFDIFLAKFDTDGNHVWSQAFGGAEFAIAADVTVDSLGNSVLTGNFRGTADFGGGVLTSAGDSDAVLAKYDPAGGHLWSKRFGDDDHQSGITTTTDGSDNVLVAGVFQRTIDLGGGLLTNTGYQDGFLAKLDP